MNIHEKNFFLFEQHLLCICHSNYSPIFLLLSLLCWWLKIAQTERYGFFILTSVVHFQSTWHHQNHTAYSKPNGTILFASFMYAALLSIHCSYILCSLATTHSRSWWNVTKFILLSFFSCLLILGAVKSGTRYRVELKRFKYFFFFCVLIRIRWENKMRSLGDLFFIFSVQLITFRM